MTKRYQRSLFFPRSKKNRQLNDKKIPKVSFCHCVVCSSFRIPRDSDHSFGIFLSLCCLFFFDTRDSDYSFGIFLSLCCLFFFDLGILITPLVSFCHCVVCSSLTRDSDHSFGIFLTKSCPKEFFFARDSDHSFGIFLSLCCLTKRSSLLGILITPLVSFCHCVVCSSELI